YYHRGPCSCLLGRPGGSDGDVDRGVAEEEAERGGKVTKYHSRKTEYAGYVFDSKAEARRYQELLLLEKAGEITDIELQPEFVLVYPFTHQGKKYRGVKYRADFRYRHAQFLNSEWI